MSIKRIALFGLGAQERYPERFASSLMRLYEVFKGYGAELVGSWSTEGYTFEQSAAFAGMPTSADNSCFNSYSRL